MCCAPSNQEAAQGQVSVTIWSKPGRNPGSQREELREGGQLSLIARRGGSRLVACMDGSVSQRIPPQGFMRPADCAGKGVQSPSHFQAGA